MNEEISNALKAYFETLYYMNRNIIALCGMDVTQYHGQYETIVQDIIQAIPRLVPYKYNNTVNKCVIVNNGLMEYSAEIPFLHDDYTQLLNNHYVFLNNARVARNNFEHTMHNIRLKSGVSLSGAVSFMLTFEIREKEICFHDCEFISFVKELNILFSKLQETTRDFADKSMALNDAYYRRLLRYNFEDFNKIYNSDLLFLFGKLLFPF